MIRSGLFFANTPKYTKNPTQTSINPALVAWALDRVGVGDIERSCSAVTFGRLAADLLSLLLMSLAGGVFSAARRLRENSCQWTGYVIYIIYIITSP